MAAPHHMLRPHALALLAALALSPIGCDRPAPPSPPPSSSASTPAAATVFTATTFKPIDYFEAQCARCHGNYGSAYGVAFGGKKDDAQLNSKVSAMCSGPGMKPLKGQSLDILVAFHRSLIDKKPFVIVNGEMDGSWYGETTAGSTLEVPGASSPAITLNGHSWTLMLPTPSEGLVLRTSKDGKVVEVPLTAGAHSHVAGSP